MAGPGDPNTDELLTDAEIATLLRTSVRGVRDRVQRGGKLAEFVVPGLKPRRFRAAQVRAWLGLSTEVGA